MIEQSVIEKLETKPARGGIAAVAWSPFCQRTSQYARRLNASPYMIHYLQWKRPLIAPFKYVLQSLKTWVVLARQRPKVIYVAVSPVFSALAVALYCWVTGAKFVIDIHGNALRSKKWGWSVPLLRWLTRRAMANVIDQERYRELLTRWGARAFLLDNPPTTVKTESLNKVALAGKFAVTVVNTFNEDEPLEPVLGAARLLPEVSFYVTGDTTRAKKSALHTAPPNVVFTGYLHKENYWSQLYSSQAVLVLTTNPYSLLGGAQDGMILGKPLLVSDQPALREYFTRGTVFVEHSPESIARGVQAVQDHETSLAEEIRSLAEEKRVRWEAEFARFASEIGGQLAVEP